MKIDKQHILEDSLATALGIGVVFVGAVVVAKLLTKFGVPVYNSLSSEEIHAVYSQLDQNCKLLSRVCGQDGNCQYCRGIYTGCGPLLYYRWQSCPDGKEHLNLYHLPYEDWTTEPSWNPFADIPKLVFPLIEAQQPLK